MKKVLVTGAIRHKYIVFDFFSNKRKHQIIYINIIWFIWQQKMFTVLLTYLHTEEFVTGLVNDNDQLLLSLTWDYKCCRVKSPKTLVCENGT